MKYKLYVILMLSPYFLMGQSISTDRNHELTAIESQLSRIEKNETEQKEEVENLKEKLNKNLISLDRLNTKIEQVDTKYNYYLIFGSLVLAIFVFLMQFFGRKWIKERVEVLIKDTATEYAKIKTDELVNEYTKEEKIDKIIREKGEPAIQNLLQKLEEKGVLVIDNIRKEVTK